MYENGMPASKEVSIAVKLNPITKFPHFGKSGPTALYQFWCVSYATEQHILGRKILCLNPLILVCDKELLLGAAFDFLIAHLHHDNSDEFFFSFDKRAYGNTFIAKRIYDLMIIIVT